MLLWEGYSQTVASWVRLTWEYDIFAIVAETQSHVAIICPYKMRRIPAEW
jgi:hypothetical protein